MSDSAQLLDDPVQLLSDPIFQLNMVIWSVKDLPENGSSQVKPFLREAGYYIFALNRRILLTELAKRSPLPDSIPDLNPTVPDVWLRHENDDFDLILELKSRSFGEKSSNAKQISKMLAGSFDLSHSLGIQNKKPGFLIIVTLYKDADKMMDTLNLLKDKLEKEHVSSAPIAVIGLDNDKDNWLWKSIDSSALPKPLQKGLSQPVTILKSMGHIEDIIPMYFIPWLPEVNEEDSPLISDGLSVFTGRVLSYVQKQIRNFEPPGVLSLRAEPLLKEATYGVFDYWKGKDRNRFTKKVINIIRNHVNVDNITYKSDTVVEIEIRTESIREDILKDLESYEVSNRAMNLEGASSSIQLYFDDV